MKQVLKHSHLRGAKACPGQIVENADNFESPVLLGFAYGSELMHPVGDQIDKLLQLGQCLWLLTSMSDMPRPVTPKFNPHA